MKNVSFATQDSCPSRNPKGKLSAFAVLSLFLAFAGAATNGANLLINSSFETNQNAHVIPQNWIRFAPPTGQGFGNYWVEGARPPHSGTMYFKEWGVCYNGNNSVAGLYQDFSSAPGSVYQASGWCYTR